MVVTASRTYENAAQPGFVMVARMPQLTDFTANELLNTAAASDAITYRDGDILDSLHDTPQPIFIYSITDHEQRLRCVQQITTAYNTSYLATACAPNAQFNYYNNEFGDLLSTFQILEPYDSN